MKYPVIPLRSRQKETLDVFLGYHHDVQIGDGEFYEMENMSSDRFPVLSPRGKRRVYAQPLSPQALLGSEQLIWVDGSALVLGETKVEMGLDVSPAMCPKRLVRMGSYLIILPDKMYVNVLEPEDFGPIGRVNRCENADLAPCDESGTELTPSLFSRVAPEAPENGAFWVDTAANRLMRWSEAEGKWQEAPCAMKISGSGIGGSLAPGDGVTVTGISGLEAGTVIACAEDWVMLPCPPRLGETGVDVTIERPMPDLDFVVESGNRLWGCKYGPGPDGNVINEIRASALGDFRNWQTYRGVSTDSYAASCGTEGPFTGAIVHLGQPIFFKEGCMHKVFGSYPANFQIQTIPCRGVEPGSGESLAVVDETLFYKSRSGICAYDGSLPVEVGRALGRGPYRNAVGGALGSKYYVSMEDGDGERQLFVYDAARGLWHREDDLSVLAFAAHQGRLYAIDGKSRNILDLTAGEEGEERIAWMVQTGELGAGPGRQYVSRLTMNLWLEPGARMEVLARYDGETQWQTLAVVFGTRRRQLSLPLRPRRCDHFTLQLRGEGAFRLYSLTKTMEKGSE